MQILLLETLLLIWNNIFASGKKEGTEQETFFHKSALFNQKYHCSWLALKANVMASHNAGRRNRLVSLVDIVTQPDLNTAKNWTVAWLWVGRFCLRLFSDIPIYFFWKKFAKL